MTEIVLVAGPVKVNDRMGHHDYFGGCALLAELLNRIPGTRAKIVENGWPYDSTVFEDADAIVFYEGGNGKQQFLRDPTRLDFLQSTLERRRVGLCLFHQATVFPQTCRHLSQRWLGGAYIPKESVRGHWNNRQHEFPDHPIFKGVTPWAGRDGWMTGFQFHRQSERVTPLLYSSPRDQSASNLAKLVSWFYTRPDGGVSFAFTGLDHHRVWRRYGLRRMLVNAILWTAGGNIPQDDAIYALSRREIKNYRTERASVIFYLENKARSALRSGGKVW